MPLVKDYKKYFLIILLISSFLITANYLAVNQINSDVEPITELDSSIIMKAENVTYVTVPIRVHKIKGTIVSMEEIENNIEELNEIFKNEMFNQPVAIFMWDHQIHEINDPEGNDDGIIEYDLESRDRVRGEAEDSAHGQGISITLCNYAGRPDLTAITNIGESHGAILTTGTDGSDWAHEIQHALGLDHGPILQANEDLDGLTGDPILDLLDIYDLGNDANGDGTINNDDRNYNAWGIKRNRLFNGLFLSAADFNMEQTYHRSHLRLGNRLLHGYGIVCGLQVDDNRSDTLNSTTGLEANKTNVDLKSSKIRVNFTASDFAVQLNWTHKLVESPKDYCSYEICISDRSAPGDPNPGLHLGANIRLNITKLSGFLEARTFKWNDGFGIWEEIIGPIIVNQEETVIEALNFYNDTGSGYAGGIQPTLISASINNSVYLQQLGIGDLGQGIYDIWGVSQWFYDPDNNSRFVFDTTETETVVDMLQPQPLIHSITPASVPKGSNITVNATGFPPNSNVTLKVGNSNFTVKANATGAILANITIPPNPTTNLTIISAIAPNIISAAAYIHTYYTFPRLDPISPNPSLTGVINLNWYDVINATIYYIYRDTSFISSVFGLIPNATSTSSSHQDTVPNGTYYYVIVAGNGTANSTLSNCENVTVTIPPPAPTLPSKIFVYVNSTIYKSINASLMQFKADLVSLGHNVTLINFSSTMRNRFLDAARIKQQCVSSYASGLEGIIFVGKLPYVHYEIFNTPFVCDLYFMDLDGQWNDWDGNNAFENHSAGTGDRDPEIWFGRIDASTMTGRDEITALRQYFQRNHLYRNGTLRRPHSSLIYIDDDWSPWTNEWVGESVHAYTNQTVIADNNVTDDSNYENALTFTHEWVHVFVHSWHDKHVFKPFATAGDTSWSEIRSINTDALFYLLYACSAADISRSNNIATEYLFSNNSLATVGCTRTGGMLQPSKFYKPLGNGSSLGEAFVRWFSDCTLPSAGLNNPANSYGMTLLGDPTLKVLYGPIDNPPVLSALTRNNYTVHLNWTKVSDASIYYVYRNTTKITTTTGLTPISWTTNNYTDNIVPSGGIYHYVIVAGNDYGNSSLSNCQNITIPIIQILNPPTLYSITPDPSPTGIINVNWSDIIGATIYYVYRNTSTITSTVGLTPIATVTPPSSNYTESIAINGSYFYVIVAGNATMNSSISNCENVTVAIPPSPPSIPGIPLLYSITPDPSPTGIITVNWSDVVGATIYYVYRNTSTITSIAGLTPIATVTPPTSDYTESITINGTYFYVIVAGNATGNSSISNCENVTVTIPPSPPPLPTSPNPPVLYPISPNPSTTGIINVTWSYVEGATIYYIYRATSTISSITGMIPIETTDLTTYQDTISTDGTYYYVVVAGNSSGNSSISNCENVTVDMPSKLPRLIYIFIIIGITAIVIVVIVVIIKIRKKGA